MSNEMTTTLNIHSGRNQALLRCTITSIADTIYEYIELKAKFNLFYNHWNVSKNRPNG